MFGLCVNLKTNFKLNVKSNVPMSELKQINPINVNLPFPYPMVSSKGECIWPLNEEGFMLIYATLDQTNAQVIVSDTTAIFLLIKMGFFGINSNKEINHFCLIENLKVNEHVFDSKKKTPQFSLGFYSLESTDIPPTLTKYDHDANTKKMSEQTDPKSPACLTSLKLCLEEAYFLSYTFGLLNISKSSDQFYPLKELWTCFCGISDQNNCARFEARYAAYHFFRSKGWVVRYGFKFGVDYLLYKEGPPFYHAFYSVIVLYQIEGMQPDKKFNWSEISGLTRVSKNARKQLLICTIHIPSGILQDISLTPECIRHFEIDLVQVNRWNSSKGEFDVSKVFPNTS